MASPQKQTFGQSLMEPTNSAMSQEVAPGSTTLSIPLRAATFASPMRSPWAMNPIGAVMTSSIVGSAHKRSLSFGVDPAKGAAAPNENSDENTHPTQMQATSRLPMKATRTSSGSSIQGGGSKAFEVGGDSDSTSPFHVKKGRTMSDSVYKLVKELKGSSGAHNDVQPCVWQALSSEEVDAAAQVTCSPAIAQPADDMSASKSVSPSAQEHQDEKSSSSSPTMGKDGADCNQDLGVEGKQQADETGQVTPKGRKEEEDEEEEEEVAPPTCAKDRIQSVWDDDSIVDETAAVTPLAPFSAKKKLIAISPVSSPTSPPLAGFPACSIAYALGDADDDQDEAKSFVEGVEETTTTPAVVEGSGNNEGGTEPSNSEGSNAEAAADGGEIGQEAAAGEVTLPVDGALDANVAISTDDVAVASDHHHAAAASTGDADAASDNHQEVKECGEVAGAGAAADVESDGLDLEAIVAKFACHTLGDGEGDGEEGVEGGDSDEIRLEAREEGNDFVEKGGGAEGDVHALSSGVGLPIDNSESATFPSKDDGVPVTADNRNIFEPSSAPSNSGEEPIAGHALQLLSQTSSPRGPLTLEGLEVEVAELRSVCITMQEVQVASHSRIRSLEEANKALAASVEKMRGAISGKVEHERATKLQLQLEQMTANMQRFEADLASGNMRDSGSQKCQCSIM